VIGGFDRSIATNVNHLYKRLLVFEAPAPRNRRQGRRRGQRRCFPALSLKA
jgi:hypothetical protein